MGLPFINDFIKQFKQILFKKGIIVSDKSTEAKATYDLLIIDVSAIIFKYMIGQYLMKSQGQSLQDIDVPTDDNLTNDDCDNNEHTTKTTISSLIPSVEQSIKKLFSYNQFTTDTSELLFVFDPIHSSQYTQISDPSINKPFLDKFIPNNSISKIQTRIDFNKLKTIKEETWQQRDKTKHLEASIEIKKRLTQLYITLQQMLSAQNTSTQNTSTQKQRAHCILSKYETDMMIGSLYQQLSSKYSILTITEDSDMLIHAYPGQVYLPHIGIIDSKKFWQLFNLTTKQQISYLPFHYGCDYQIKNISITSKNSFDFLHTLQQEQHRETSTDEQLISLTFLYEQYIETDYQQTIKNCQYTTQ